MTMLKLWLKGKDLYELFDMISRLVSEVRLHATQDGVDIRFIDPAKVVAVKIWIPSVICEYYDCSEEFEVGVDVNRVKEFLSVVKNDNIEFIVEEEVEVDGNKFPNAIVIKAGNLIYILASIDPNAIRKSPPEEEFEHIKEITDDCTVEIDAKMFKEIIKTVKREYGTKVVAFVHTPTETYVYNGAKKFEPYFFCSSSEVIAVYSVEYLEPLTHISTDSYRIQFSKDTPCLVEPEYKFDIMYVVAPYTIEEEELRKFLPTKIIEYKYKFVISAEVWKIYRSVLSTKYPWYLVVKHGEVCFASPLYKLLIPIDKSVVHFITLTGKPHPKGDVFEIDVSAFRNVKDNLEVVCVDDKIYVEGKEVGWKPEDKTTWVRNFVEIILNLYNKIEHEVIEASFDVKDLTTIFKESDTIALYCDKGNVCLSPAVLLPNGQWALEKTRLKRKEAQYCEPFVRVFNAPEYVVGSFVEFIFTTTPKTPVITVCYVERKREHIPVLWRGIEPIEDEEKAVEQLWEVIYGRAIERLLEEKPIEDLIKKTVDDIIKLLSESISKAEVKSILEYELRRRGYSRDVIENAIEDLIHKGVIERWGKYLRLKKVPEEEKPPVEEVEEGRPPEEKPEEEKPLTKPTAEPYDFVLEKLKSVFLAELELAGVKKEEAEKELEVRMFEFEKLAKDVAEGRLPQTEAVKKVIKDAREFAKPPLEVPPPEEVKIEKPPVIEKPPEVVRPPEVIRPPEVAPPEVAEVTEKAMHIKDVLKELGWEGVVELLKPHLPEIFAQGLWNFFETHKEWSMAIPPVRKHLEPIFRNLRSAIEQRAMENYRLGRLTFREWLIGGAPEEVRLPLLSDLIYLGYTSKQFVDDLRKAYENPKVQKVLRKVVKNPLSFGEFYHTMIEFLKQYRL